MKTITYNDGAKDKTLTVLAVSSGVYNGVKNTLKILIDGEAHSFDEIHDILNNTGDIIEKEDGTTVFVHSGFELLPKENFLGHIENNKWDITLIQKNATQEAVANSQDAIAELTMALLELQERVIALEGGNTNG